MLKYGAKQVYKLGIGSDHDDNIIEYFDKWKNGIWDELKVQFSTQSQIENISMDIENSEFDIVESNFEYEAIVSSFYKAKKLHVLQAEADRYRFKTQRYLTYKRAKISTNILISSPGL